jgi:hypothetical protein
MTGSQWPIDRRTRVSKTTHASTRLTPERDEPLHRRGRQVRERRRFVHPGIDATVVGVAPGRILATPAPLQQLPEPWLHGGQHLRHVQRGQTRRRMKPDRSRRVTRKHPVEHQRVDVDVEIERSPEPLDDRDGASARLLEADRARVVPQQAEDGAEEDSGDPPAEVVIPRQPVPQSVRQTQDPLSDWNVGDDAIDQVGSAFRHPPATTTRAERAPLARERDEPIQGAPVAAKPREATSQEPAPEEVPKRALDEWRQAGTVAQPRRLGQERLEVILHDLVKDAAAGIAGFVARGRPGHPAHDAEAVPTSQPTPFGQNWRFPS